MIKEGAEEGALDTFNKVGKDGRSLGGFKAIKWLDGARVEYWV